MKTTVDNKINCEDFLKSLFDVSLPISERIRRLDYIANSSQKILCDFIIYLPELKKLIFDVFDPNDHFKNTPQFKEARNVFFKLHIRENILREVKAIYLKKDQREITDIEEAVKPR